MDLDRRCLRPRSRLWPHLHHVAGGGRRKVGTHQVGFYLRHGYLPPVVRHTAGAASTLNVNLYLSLKGGDQRKNVVLDRDARDDNTPCGCRNVRSLLTPQKVRIAREAVCWGESVRATTCAGCRSENCARRHQGPDVDPRRVR